MEVIKEGDIVSLKLNRKDIIKAELYNKKEAILYNVYNLYCSVCNYQFGEFDYVYLCGDNGELLCKHCYEDYIMYAGNNPERALGTQIRKLNKFLDKHEFNKRINNQTFELEDI